MRTGLIWIAAAGVAALLGACQGPEEGSPGVKRVDPTEIVTEPTASTTSTDSTSTPTPSDTGTEAGPTWHQDVAPLLADRCGACHVDGGIGPFSVETYDEAVTWGYAIDDAVQTGRMPPFHADDADCAMPADLKEDVRLSDADKDLVSEWVSLGMPEGDPDTAAPAPLRSPGELSSVDLQVGFQQDFTVTGDRDIYQCFRVPLTGLTEDVWVTGLQVVPGNDTVVHHVLVWADPQDESASRAGSDGSYRCTGFPDIFPTSLMGAWTPGANPIYTPTNTGMALSPGASLVVNVHYHPTGTTDEVDNTQIQLQWTTTEPESEATYYLVDLPFGSLPVTGEFEIPAGAKAHVEANELWLPPVLFPDMRIFAVGPHMHYLGTEMKVTLKQDGKEQCLIHTPEYRFDYQTTYQYDAPVDQLPWFRGGDRIRVECTYNNSDSNPFMPLHLDARDATSPQDVNWGEETGDEMCMAIVGLVIP